MQADTLAAVKVENDEKKDTEAVQVDSKVEKEERKVEYDRGRDRGKDGRDKTSSNSGRSSGQGSPRSGQGSKVSVKIDSEDISFILGELGFAFISPCCFFIHMQLPGKGGLTKKKLANVSGTHINLREKELEIDVCGSEPNLSRGVDYVNFVMQQRVGNVSVSDGRDDLSIVKVPISAIGVVVGRQRSTLRAFEAEYGVLMLFGRVGGADEDWLCIFGELHARRAAQLKIISVIENKHPNHFKTNDPENPLTIDHVRGDDAGPGWGMETFELSDDEYPYALGKTI